MKNIINWKIFYTLLILSLISVICIFPYILTLQADLLKKIGQPIWILFLTQLVQSAILFSIAIFLGLYFSKKVNLQLPLLDTIFKKGNFKKVLKDILLMSVLSGILVAGAIYATDYLFTLQGAVISTHASLAPVWQKLLASFYGGIAEEILLRLFLMTFFIWISMKLFRNSKPTTASIVVSILLSALIFGLGHLPITASMTEIDALIIGRAAVLNGIGGIVFGWLFWKKGLESAMIAHFTADVFLLTLLPLVFK